MGIGLKRPVSLEAPNGPSSETRWGSSVREGSEFSHTLLCTLHTHIPGMFHHTSIEGILLASDMQVAGIGIQEAATHATAASRSSQLHQQDAQDPGSGRPRQIGKYGIRGSPTRTSSHPTRRGLRFSTQCKPDSAAMGPRRGVQ